MNAKKEEIIKTVDQYLSLWQNHPPFGTHTKNLNEDVLNSGDWNPWSGGSGIYIIHDSEKVYYIGRTYCRSGVGFGGRLASHIQKKNQDGWKEILRDDRGNVVVLIFNFNPDYKSCQDAKLKEADYWIAGMELFLIDKLEPTLNYNRG